MTEFTDRIIRETEQRRRDLLEPIAQALDEIRQLDSMLAALGRQPDPLPIPIPALAPAQPEAPAEEPPPPEPRQSGPVAPEPERVPPPAQPPAEPAEPARPRIPGKATVDGVFAALKKAGVATNSDLAERTDYTVPRIGEALAHLERQGRIKALDEQKRNRRWTLAGEEGAVARDVLYSTLLSKKKATAGQLREFFGVDKLGSGLYELEEAGRVERYNYGGDTWFRPVGDSAEEGTTAESQEEASVPPSSATPTTPESSPSARTITFAGAEAVAEHLRGMPAAHVNIAPKSRVGPAEFQLKIVEAFKEEGGPLLANVVTDKVGDRTDKTFNARVGKMLRQLQEAGMVRQTGNLDHAPWQKAQMRSSGRTAGRPSVEYELLYDDVRKVPTEEGEAPKAEDTRPFYPEAKTSTTPDGEDAPPEQQESTASARERPTLEQVRDAVTKFNGMFGVSAVAEALPEDERKPAIVERRLGQLMERGIIQWGMEAAGLYEYHRAKDPGRAAQIDRQQREQGGATGGNGGGGPVAGTGKQSLPGNQATRELLREATSAGSTYEVRGTGHVMVTAPSGTKVLIASTPNTPGHREDRRRLKRVGAI